MSKLTHLCAGLALTLLIPAQPVSAALYGYIDEKGEAHFSSNAEDERYQLFVKDGELTDAVDARVQHEQARGQKAARKSMDKNFPHAPKIFNPPNLAKIEPLIKKHAKQHGLEAALIKAVIAAESGFNAEALSPKGAIGLMQIIPATGERYGVKTDTKGTIEKKLTDPTTNIGVGVRYLRDLLKMFAGRQDLALAAYNAGEGAVQKYRNQIPPYPETQNYVSTVLQLYHVYAPIAATPTHIGRVHIKVGGRRNMPE